MGIIKELIRELLTFSSNKVATLKIIVIVNTVGSSRFCFVMEKIGIENS